MIRLNSNPRSKGKKKTFSSSSVSFQIHRSINETFRLFFVMRTKSVNVLKKRNHKMLLIAMNSFVVGHFHALKIMSKTDEKFKTISDRRLETSLLLGAKNAKAKLSANKYVSGAVSNSSANVN